MMRVWRFVVAVCLWVSLSTLAGPVGAQPQTFREGWYRLESVIDGDSIRVRGIAKDIRLAGVNTPEVDELLHDEAVNLVREFLTMNAGGEVYLIPAEKPCDVDCRRYRAYVWYWDNIYGDWWISQDDLAWFGLACVDHVEQWKSTGNYYEWLSDSERTAKAKRLGIWANNTTCPLRNS